MTTYYPISLVPIQYEDASGNPYSGAVLKAYSVGTTTPMSMATSYTGAITVSSMTLNASGYPAVSGNVVIPHFISNYKLALYPTQADADLDTGAIWTVDNNQLFLTPSLNSTFDKFNGTGAQTVFTLSQDLGTQEKSVIVFVDAGAGEGFQPMLPTAFTLSGTTLTFNAAPASGTDNIRVYCPSTSDASAAASATAAAASAVSSAADVVLTHADVVLTHADVVLTHADVVLTHADVVLTHADVVSTGLDKVATAADRVQTGLDAVATAADVVSANSARDIAKAAGGFTYTYSTNTAASDPTSGVLKFNNANLSLATALYISETTGLAQAIAAELATWDDSTSTIHAKLRLFKQSDTSVFVIFNVTGTTTDNGTWDTLTVAYVAGTTSLTNADVVTIQPIRNGDKGDTVTPIAIADSSGTVDAITANFVPDLSLTDNIIVAVVSAGVNTVTNPTLNVDGSGALTIKARGNATLVAGDTGSAGYTMLLRYEATGTYWELINPAITKDSDVVMTNYSGGGAATVASATIHDMHSGVHSRGVFRHNGDGLVSANGATAVDVAACRVTLRATNDKTDELEYLQTAAVTNHDITALLAVGAVYVYIGYSTGATIQYSNTNPDTSNEDQRYILLAEIHPNDAGTAIDQIHDIREFVGNHPQELSILHKDVFGVLVSGQACSITGTRKLAIAAGTFHVHGYNNHVVSAFDTNVASTFIHVYYNGAAWVKVATQTDVDNLQYNNPASGLATLGTNKWKKDWVFRGQNGTVYVLYGQGEYTNEQAAIDAVMPTLPDFLTDTDHRYLMASVTIQKSSATATIRDLANRFNATNASFTNDHGNLSGLLDNDHPQYHLLTDILPSASGGTANGFTKFTGATTSEKTYTLPNASATILTDNAAVTVAQGGTGLATLTANNVILGNGTSTPSFVAPSTSGNVLTSNGTTWTSAAPAGGGSELVLLATATASSSASLDFNSVISSSYSHYRMIAIDLVTSASSNITISADDVATFVAATANFTWATQLHTLGGTTAITYPTGGINATAPSMILNGDIGAGGVFNMDASFQIGGTDTVTGAHFMWYSRILSDQGLSDIHHMQIIGRGTTTVASLRLAPISGTFTSGKVYLYGVKNT